VLKVAGLAKAYGSQTLFQDVSFNVNRRERIGLVGRNGHGKTTLFRILLGLEEPDAGSVTLPRHYTLGYVEQEVRFSRPTVRGEACLALKGGGGEAWRAEKILLGLGFAPADLDREPSTLSGGFQVRLNLAKVLAAEPDCLLLDEPTNYLDIVSIRWLSRFLREWKGELLLITHDRAFMDGVTTHTLAIHRRRLRKFTGGTAKAYEQIAQEEETHEKTRLNDEKKRRQEELYIRRFRAKARLAGLVQSRIKMLARRDRMEKLEAQEDLEFQFNAAPFEAKRMGEVSGLTFSYERRAPWLVEGLSLALGPRERLCIVGRNGKGKSTLLKLLAGRLRPAAGGVGYHPAVRLGYLGQTPEHELNPELTVAEELMAAAPGCTLDRARELAGALMFPGDMALRKTAHLSGGEKSRVLMGKVLLTPCHLLLLDEPTNHLDMESCDALLAALDAFEGSVVMVTHNEMFLHALATRLVVFDRGRAFEYVGPYQEFLDQVGWEGDEAPPPRPAAEAPAPAGARQEAKRARAVLLQERSRTLHPLEEEAARLEGSIVELESEQAANDEALVRASTDGDAAAIAALAKRQREIPPLLDGLYDRLDGVTRDLEGRRAEFEQRLRNLSGDDT
jgi:ATP-binding cassette subfamily F protein 3